MVGYRVPLRGEEPSEEMVEWLHKNPLEWSGDDDGMIFEMPSGDEVSATHGDLITIVDGVYSVIKMVDVCSKWQPSTNTKEVKI